jgi:hypothetical protein
MRDSIFRVADGVNIQNAVHSKWFWRSLFDVVRVNQFSSRSVRKNKKEKKMYVRSLRAVYSVLCAVYFNVTIRSARHT